MTKENQDYLANSYQFRGYIIDTFISLEKTIESIICEHFTGSVDMNGDFRNIMLDRMSFETKRDCIRSIFNLYETRSGFIKTSKNSFPNSKLFEEIRLINNERNYFAHYILAFMPKAKKDYVIILAEARDKVKLHKYKVEDIKSIHDRIFKACDNLNEIWKSHRDNDKK